MMSGKTTYTSLLCKIKCFKWVMFFDETASFPDNMITLGCYLGPSIYVGPALSTKIFTHHEQVLHMSTYRLLTLDHLRSYQME